MRHYMVSSSTGVSDDGRFTWAWASACGPCASCTQVKTTQSVPLLITLLGTHDPMRDGRY